jgi:TolB-like protein
MVYSITSDRSLQVTRRQAMMNADQLYELAQIREQEYMLEGTVRRSARRLRRRQGGGLIAGAARRLRRRTHTAED